MALISLMVLKQYKHEFVTHVKAKSIAKQNHDIQVKDKLWGKECWIREVFRLIIATICEIKKTIHEL